LLENIRQSAITFAWITNGSNGSVDQSIAEERKSSALDVAKHLKRVPPDALRAAIDRTIQHASRFNTAVSMERARQGIAGTKGNPSSARFVSLNGILIGHPRNDAETIALIEGGVEGIFRAIGEGKIAERVTILLQNGVTLKVETSNEPISLRMEVSYVDIDRIRRLEYTFSNLLHQAFRTMLDSLKRLAVHNGFLTEESKPEGVVAGGALRGGNPMEPGFGSFSLTVLPVYPLTRPSSLQLRVSLVPDKKGDYSQWFNAFLQALADAHVLRFDPDLAREG